MTMLPPEASPLHQLVAPWWQNQTTVRPHGIPALRIHLWAAAVREMRANTAAGRVYDPGADSRFAWASQFLNRAAGYCQTIDPNITARAAYVFDPPRTPCGRDRAAANHN